MTNLKIKLIMGFRQEQHISIDAEEAHKAYWLFFHPEERGVFNNGMAIIGKNIQGIQPDYQGSMGWNATHTLDSDDMNEIRQLGVDRKLRDVLSEAKEVAQLGKPELMTLPLSVTQERLIGLPSPQ